MKRLLCILLLFVACASARATSNIVATITFTNVVNGVTNGGTITINGDQRNYTNGVLASAATWIQSTNIVGHAATNTLFHLSSYPVANVFRYTFSGTNALTVESDIDTVLTVTLSSGIGTVSYVTNVFSALRPVLLPLESLLVASTRTQAQDRIIHALNLSYGTDKVASAAAPFTNFLNLYSIQTASNKTVYHLTNQSGMFSGGRATNVIGLHGTNYSLFGGVIEGHRSTNVIALHGTNYSLYGGTYTAPTLANVVTLSGTLGRMTNGYVTNLVADSPIMTNGANYGSAFQSHGSGTYSFQAGLDAVASGYAAVAVGNGSVASGPYDTAFGSEAEATGGSSAAFGLSATALATNAMAIGTGSSVQAPGGIAIGPYVDVAAGHTNSIGIGADTTGTNQIMAGTSSHTLRVPGMIHAASSTNNFLTGSNRVGGAWGLTRRTDSSQPTGHNIVTNSASDSAVWLTAPAGTCTNVGFTDGWDGRVIRYVKYNGGYNMGIANESGLASAERRVLTGTGADVTITNSPGWFELMYDATLSRWILTGYSR